MIKKIIVIRHGDYDKETMDLNPIGRSQIKKLIPEIRKNIEGYKKIALLTSNSLRAETSMKIISEELRIPYESSEFLCFDGEHPEDTDRAVDFVAEKRKDDVDLIIITTHIAYALSIPRRFAWYFAEDILKDIVKKGEMVIIDRFNKIVSYYS